MRTGGRTLVNAVEMQTAPIVSLAEIDRRQSMAEQATALSLRHGRLSASSRRL